MGLVLAHDLPGKSGHKHRDSEEAWVAGSFMVVMLLLLLCCLATSPCMSGWSGYGMSGCGDWCGRDSGRDIWRDSAPPCAPGLVGRPLTSDCARCGAVMVVGPDGVLVCVGCAPCGSQHAAPAAPAAPATEQIGLLQMLALGAAMRPAPEDDTDSLVQVQFTDTDGHTSILRECGGALQWWSDQEKTGQFKVLTPRVTALSWDAATRKLTLEGGGPRTTATLSEDDARTELPKLRVLAKATQVPMADPTAPPMAKALPWPPQQH